MGQIIKGKPVGDALSDQLKVECEALVKEGIQPKLAILRVGAKPNDLSYEKGALKKCETIGIQTEVTELPEGTTQDEYIAALEKLKKGSKLYCLYNISYKDEEGSFSKVNVVLSS